MPDTVSSVPSSIASAQLAHEILPGVAGEEVLIVIPTLNEARHIKACVESLFEGDERVLDARIVVVDGGSKDATLTIVRALSERFPNVELLKNPLKLQSAAINLAVQKYGSDHTILVRCDAHSIYPPGYVMDVADSLRSREVESIATPMDALGKGIFQKANAFIVDTPLGSGGSAHRGGKQSGFVDHGHHAGFDLSWFGRVGGYDPTFSHNEDAEYDCRLRRAGGRIYLDTDIRIGYYPRATARSLAKQYYNYGKGRARTLLKHGVRPRIRQMLPPAVFLACLAALAVAPFAPAALIVPAGYLGVLALASLIITIREESLCGLLSGLASLTMHMSWSAGFLRQMLFSQRRRPPSGGSRGKPLEAEPEGEPAQPAG